MELISGRAKWGNNVLFLKFYLSGRRLLLLFSQGFRGLACVRNTWTFSVGVGRLSKSGALTETYFL